MKSESESESEKGLTNDEDENSVHNLTNEVAINQTDTWKKGIINDISKMAIVIDSTPGSTPNENQTTMNFTRQ